ncbi:hypothetical protein Q7P37_011572 [Cladosporium fusiforme]
MIACRIIASAPLHNFRPYDLNATGCWDSGDSGKAGGAVKMEQYFRNRVSVDDVPDLARDRRANDSRLKSRFEHIFAKYGKDFEGVGDEIDLETGEVHVNNGHLENMRHEVDPGRSGSSQVLRVFGSSLDKSIGPVRSGRVLEEERLEGEEEEEEEETSDVSSKSGYSSSADEDENQFHDTSRHAPDELSSDFYPEDDDVPSMEHQPQSPSHLRQSVPANKINDEQEDQPLETAPGNTTENMPLDMPLLRESIGAIQTTSRQHGSIDPSTIQALGLSIANQLARFMSGAPKSKSKSKSKKQHSQNNDRDHSWDYPSLPGDRRGRTPNPPQPLAASSSAAMFSASPGGQASIWAPVHQPRPQKRRRIDKIVNARAAEAVINGNHSNLLQNHAASERSAERGSKESKQSQRKICANCGETESPNFRKGPDGIRLCNPCGMYYYRYGLLKPLGEQGSSRGRKAKLSALPVQVPGERSQSDRAVDEFDIPVTPFSRTTPGYTANTGRRMSGERARRPRYTAEEEESIIRLREVDQLSWTEIGRLVSNRSWSSVCTHYYRLCNNPAYSGRLRSTKPNRLAESAPASDTDHEHRPHPENRSTTSASAEPDVLMPLEYTSEEDDIIMRMRDEEDMSFEEMTEYLIGRDAEALQQRYDHLGTLEQDHQQTASDVSDGAEVDSDNELEEGFRERDDRMRMPPPPRPVQTALLPQYGTSEAAKHNRKSTSDIADTDSPVPQTPSLPIPISERPPGYSQVGPSAWFNTQPASKGPLPFQPARKRFVPIQPMGRRDPFGPRPMTDEHANKSHRSSKPSKPTLMSHAHSRSRTANASSTRAVPSHAETITPTTPSLTPVEGGLIRASESAGSKESQDLEDRAREARPAAKVHNDRAIMTEDNSMPSIEVSEDEDHSSDFTPKQDRFITNAREKKGLTWIEITANLPGRVRKSSQAVADRYYDHIVSAKGKGKADAGTAESSSDQNYRHKRYSEEESEKIVQLKEEGLSWSEIADQFPGRAEASVRNHYWGNLMRGQKQGRRKSKVVAIQQPHSAAPLLRQALGSSTWRGSKDEDDTAYTQPRISLDDLRHRFGSRNLRSASKTQLTSQRNLQDSEVGSAQQSDDAGFHNESISTDQDQQHSGSGGHGLASPKPSANVQEEQSARGPTGSTPFTALQKLQLEQPGQVSFPEPATVVRSSPPAYLDTSFDAQPGGHNSRPASPDTAAVYDTPAKSSDHAMPYFLVSSATTNQQRYASNAQLHKSPGEAYVAIPSDHDVQQAEEDHGILFESDEVKSHSETQAATVASTSGKKRKRASGGSKRISDFEVADSDPDSLYEHVQEEVVTLPLTTAKRGPGRPRISDSQSGSKPQRKKQSISKPVSEPATPMARTRRGVVPTREAVVKGSAGVTNRKTGSSLLGKTASSPNGPNDTIDDNSQSRPEDDQMPDRPLHSHDDWAKALTSALQSHPEQRLRCKDIIIWVRENNSFYRDNEEPWDQRLRYYLKRNPSFQQIDPSNPRKSPWTFTRLNVDSAPAAEPMVVENTGEDSLLEGDDDAPSAAESMGVGITREVPPESDGDAPTASTPAAAEPMIVNTTREDTPLEDDYDAPTASAPAAAEPMIMETTAEEIVFEGDDDAPAVSTPPHAEPMIVNNSRENNPLGDNGDAPTASTPAAAEPMVIETTAEEIVFEGDDDAHGASKPPSAEPMVMDTTREDMLPPGDDGDAPTASTPPAPPPQPEASAASPKPDLHPDIVDIKANTPGKAEFDRETNASPSFAQQAFIRRDPVSRAKALRRSDTALIRQASPLRTPFRRSTSSVARAGTPMRIELLHNAASRATPAAPRASLGPSSVRRVLEARGVSRDEEDGEQDELS